MNWHTTLLRLYINFKGGAVILKIISRYCAGRTPSATPTRFLHQLPIGFLSNHTKLLN